MSNTNKFIDSTQIKFYPSGYRGQVWLQDKGQTYSYDPESKLNTEENVTRPYRALIQYNSDYNKHTKNKGDLVIGWEGNENTTWNTSIRQGSSIRRPFIFIINGYYVKLLDSSVLSDVIADYPEAIYAHIKMRNYGIDDDKTLLDGDKFNVCLKARAATNLYQTPTAGSITSDNENDNGDSTINYTDLDGTCTEPNTCFLGIEFVRKNDLPDDGEISVNDDFYLKVLERTGNSASNYDYRVPEQSRLILRTKDIFGGNDGTEDKNLSEYFNTNIIESYNGDNTPLQIKTRNNNTLDIDSSKDITIDSVTSSTINTGTTLNLTANNNITAKAKNTNIDLRAVVVDPNTQAETTKSQIKLSNDGNILQNGVNKIDIQSKEINLTEATDYTYIKLFPETSKQKINIAAKNDIDINGKDNLNLSSDKIKQNWVTSLNISDGLQNSAHYIKQDKSDGLVAKSAIAVDLKTTNTRIKLTQSTQQIDIEADKDVISGLSGVELKSTGGGAESNITVANPNGNVKADVLVDSNVTDYSTYETKDTIVKNKISKINIMDTQNINLELKDPGNYGTSGDPARTLASDETRASLGLNYKIDEVSGTKYEKVSNKLSVKKVSGNDNSYIEVLETKQLTDDGSGNMSYQPADDNLSIAIHNSDTNKIDLTGYVIGTDNSEQIELTSKDIKLNTLSDNGVTFTNKNDESTDNTYNKTTTIKGNKFTSNVDTNATTEISSVNVGTSVAPTYIPQIKLSDGTGNDLKSTEITSRKIQSSSLVGNGQDANWAVVVNNQGILSSENLAVSDPSEDGNTTSFIATISQSKTGKITPTKKTIPDAGKDTKGLITGYNADDDQSTKYYVKIDDNNNGYVQGISTGATLDLMDGTTTYYLTSSANTSGTYSDARVNTNVYVSGNEINADSFYAHSDKRLKENLRPLDYNKSILDLPVYKYDYINGAKNQIGCMAQDLQELYPELVHENFDGYLSVDNSKVVYLLLEEVKLLKKEIEELKKNR